MRTPDVRLVELRSQLARAEAEAAGGAWAMQKARNQLERAAQQLSAVTAMLDARLAVHSDRSIAEIRLVKTA